MSTDLVRRSLVWPAVMAACAMVLVSAPARGGTATKPAATSTPAVQVEGAWVRATVKGQTATGGFMTLRASRDLTLVGFSSDAATDTELHEMAMDGSVMRMRAVERLPLPAGKAVVLKPGGHHLMLMGLKQPLTAGSEVRVELHLEDASGAHVQQAVTLPVRAGQGSAGMKGGAEPAAQSKGPGAGMGGGHHHHH